MRPYPLLALAIALALGIRIALFMQAPGLAFEAYETLIHVQHITETGLPLLETNLAWDGAHTQTTPLFYYILAFATIFLSDQTVALWIPNILISLLPIPIYLLATQLTKNNVAIITATIASAFIPILYVQTLLTANPLSLAIPLFFLAYYYFIRLAKTPKYQIHFIATVAILTLTHPIALLLAPAMGLTILLTYVQRTRFSKTLTEAAIFTTFLTVWANIIIYKVPLQWYGISTLTATPYQLTGIPQITVLVGILPLLIGVWAAFSYLTQEQDASAHAIIALLGATLIAVLTALISLTLALTIIGPTLLVLLAGGIHKYGQAKKRARTPFVYTLFFGILVVGFIITTAIPAIAIGAESMQHAPTPQDQEILSALEPGEKTLWEQENGHYLQYHGIPVPYNTATITSERSQEILQEIEELSTKSTEIRYIQALNEQEITVVVLSSDHNRPIGERCFTKLHKEHEVYKLQCVVR